MRIIAGELRRRRLHTPPDATTTRPIPDRVKQSMFDLLRGHFEGSCVLDAFAGTGAIGLEAISRGAETCVFVERDRRIASILEKNIAELGVEERARVVKGDALGPSLIARLPQRLHLAFLDPPYPLVRDADGWDRVRLQASRIVQELDDTGFMVIRTPNPFRLNPSGPTAGDQFALDGAEEEVITLDDVDALERWAEEAEVAASPAPMADAVFADMAIEGAIGPETHEHGSTAFHLYMRDRSSSAD